MGRLENKVALITGAGKGQGAYEAEVFASECASVILADVDLQACSTVQEKIEYRGGNAISIYLDVTSESDWQTCIMEIAEKYGRLNVLVNNAGMTHFIDHADLEAVTDEVWDDILGANLRGVFSCTTAAAVHRSEAGEGGGGVVRGEERGVRREEGGMGKEEGGGRSEEGGVRSEE